MTETDRITFENGTLIVPPTATVVKIIGDGVGPDIWRAAGPVLEEAARIHGCGLKWHEAFAGEEAVKRNGSPLPTETMEALKHFRVGIKGPLGTPVGGGIRSLNVAIRQELDLFACVRPIKYIPGVPSPVKNPELLDMIIFRENTEDVYAGYEWPAKSAEAQKIIAYLNEEMGTEISPESAVGLKPISQKASERLIKLAVDWALKDNRPSLTLVHKGNIMKFTEGAFRQWGYELAAREYGQKTVPLAQADKTAQEKRLIIKDCLADNMFMQTLLRPGEYSVLAMPNLNGDYLSDALAAQIGGLGVAPGCNLGFGRGVFESTHGTAPKHAGQDEVNPSSLILSGAMMFDYLGWPAAAQSVRQAVARAIREGFLTYDLARQADQKPVKCSAFGQAVLSRLK
ncbi:MAG: NADP-dependent isocitrate dehydrogenase [Deltaproteobacteria bacterium]|jgi:isocitrate dehydrogenase|nr:NADP-dependent isocitrate dehydrogenase [Deltaproteobacteria bacterium]